MKQIVTAAHRDLSSRIRRPTVMNPDYTTKKVTLTYFIVF